MLKTSTSTTSSLPPTLETTRNNTESNIFISKLGRLVQVTKPLIKISEESKGDPKIFYKFKNTKIFLYPAI